MPLSDNYFYILSKISRCILLPDRYFVSFVFPLERKGWGEYTIEKQVSSASLLVSKIAFN